MKEKVRIRRRDFLKRTGGLAMAGAIGTKHGVIREEYIQALISLRKNARI